MLSKYSKAVIAFLTPLVPFVTAVSVDPQIVAALGGTATAWLAAVGIPALTGSLAWLVRNEPTVEEAEGTLDRARARNKHER